MRENSSILVGIFEVVLATVPQLSPGLLINLYIITPIPDPPDPQLYLWMAPGITVTRGPGSNTSGFTFMFAKLGSRKF